jgi:LCP family protein required for cell wall assembly
MSGGIVADPPLPPPPNDERPSRRSQPPPGDGGRRFRWKTIVQYVLGLALVAVGLFFGFVAYGVIHDHKSIPQSISDTVPIYPKSPEVVFGKQRIYLMLLGIDYNYDDKGMPFSKDARSDTIMIAGLDFPTKSMKLVSVLRDTDAIVAGRETKINEAYSAGGVKLADAVIGDFMGMPTIAKGRHFDRYVVVNVNGVKEVVNAIGGIDVDVTENMDYDDHWAHLSIHFKKDRRYHMNGEQAQGYMRFRYDECSDPCRTKRQQQIIHIVLQKLKSDKLNDLLHIGQLISVVNRNVVTNLNDTEKKSLAWAFRDANLADLGHADTIGYVDVKETSWAGELLIPDQAQKTKLVADLIGPYGNVRPAPRGALQSVKPATVHLVVQNGSGIRGLATAVSTKLEKLGYVVDSVGNADTFRYDTTQIRPATKVPYVGERVRADLGVTGAAIAPATDSTPGPTSVVTVIVGRDYPLATARAAPTSSVAPAH